MDGDRAPASGHAHLSPLEAARRSPLWAARAALEALNARWQLRGARLGPLVRVRGRVRFERGGSLEVGERAQILSHNARTVLATFPGGRLVIGPRTVINYGSDIAATGLVEIGADCLIGTHVTILDNDFHDVEERSRRPEPRPVRIEDGAWLGNRVIVLPGVTIGAGAAVAAGSVVISDIPPRTLAMGNPARVMKKL